LREQDRTKETTVRNEIDAKGREVREKEESHSASEELIKEKEEANEQLETVEGFHVK